MKLSNAYINNMLTNQDMLFAKTTFLQIFCNYLLEIRLAGRSWVRAECLRLKTERSLPMHAYRPAVSATKRRKIWFTVLLTAMLVWFVPQAVNAENPVNTTTQTTDQNGYAASTPVSGPKKTEQKNAKSKNKGNKPVKKNEHKKVGQKNLFDSKKKAPQQKIKKPKEEESKTSPTQALQPSTAALELTEKVVEKLFNSPEGQALIKGLVEQQLSVLIDPLVKKTLAKELTERKLQTLSGTKDTSATWVPSPGLILLGGLLFAGGIFYAYTRRIKPGAPKNRYFNRKINSPRITTPPADHVAETPLPVAPQSINDVKDSVIIGAIKRPQSTVNPSQENAAEFSESTAKEDNQSGIATPILSARLSVAERLSVTAPASPNKKTKFLPKDLEQRKSHITNVILAEINSANTNQMPGKTYLP